MFLYCFLLSFDFTFFLSLPVTREVDYWGFQMWKSSSGILCDDDTLKFKAG